MQKGVEFGAKPKYHEILSFPWSPLKSKHQGVEFGAQHAAASNLPGAKHYAQSL